MHSAARALALQVRVGVFKCQLILTKVFFVVFCAEMLQQNATYISVFLSQSETLHCENKLAKEF